MQATTPLALNYSKGTGYTGWEGESEDPGVWFYVYLYDKDNNYLGADYDYITWKKGDVTSISSLKANTNASDRTFGISGVEYTNKAKLPAGLYIKNGKKVLIK